VSAGVVTIPLTIPRAAPSRAASAVPTAGKPDLTEAGVTPQKRPQGIGVLDDFIAGPENRIAQVAADAVFQEDGRYNPLVLVGPTGTGKSHLVHGLELLFRHRRPNERVHLTNGNDFARDVTAAAKTTLTDFRETLYAADLFILEDLQELLPFEHAQIELSHACDQVIGNGGRVIVTARRPLINLPGLLPGLRSRLCAGLTTPIAPPGVDARAMVLQHLARRHRLHLTEPMVRLLAEQLPLTIPLLGGVVIDLATIAESLEERLTLKLIRQYIAERTSGRKISVDIIIKTTAHYLGGKLSDMRSATRRHAVVRARGVAIYLARELTGSTLAAIGRHLGRRDHTTVLHGYRTTKRLTVSDPEIRQAVADIKKRLAS